MEPKTATRLFVSVDIVGSTAFKATRSIEDWLPVFQAFFERFPTVLIGPLATAFPQRDDLPPLDLWKALGDELVFQASLEGPEETGLLLGAVLEAAARYAGHAFATFPLALKVTAWTATFPPNARVAIPEIVERMEECSDFVGPDIDLGFRLSGHARSDSILVSLPLALHLLGKDSAPMDVMADGTAALRGVAGASSYPLLRAAPAGSAPGDGPLLDHLALRTLLVSQFCAAGEEPVEAMERLFLDMRRRPAEPERAFDLALMTLGGAPTEVRAAGRAAIASAGADHPYHNRHHLTEAVLAMGWLCATARAAGAIDAESGWIGVLAMAGHDLGHDGSRCTDGRLEWEAALAMRELGAASGLGETVLGRVQAVILETAPSAVLAARRAPGRGPAGLLGSLAREADVTASLMPRMGWCLAELLRTEWQAAGDPAAEGVTKFAERRNFLSLYVAPSPAAEALGLAALTRAQVDAFARVAERLGPNTVTPLAALDSMDRRTALRLYRAGLREASGAG